MPSSTNVYRIKEIISEKARRKELRERLINKLGISRNHFYTKIRATADSKYFFNEEEEKIIAEELNVPVADLKNPELNLEPA